MGYAIYLDVNRCVGCQACIVACMDQNDGETGKEQIAWRQVFVVERGEFPRVKVNYISLSCMNCQDAPCLMICPTRAISMEEYTGIILVDARRCIGCHSCALVCPFGVPRFGQDGKMQKCNLCIERIKQALEPACVRACPAKALQFGPVNELLHQVEGQVAARMADATSCLMVGKITSKSRNSQLPSA
ncbi:Anaerobic dimethyl sulfoxide reductase chain B [Neomoorella glycerini]|uniref:Anaerobic dimethyl sulfoxide reductase chain B n=1 Tax=Neomoorella glycerini TaxID=55779 RepID=A0A6I5ZPP9_9FIRM|nr:4Fe-4S dicluster domain-containing protein [Moorella glycerini]QGP91501.1 Anaerobic dimethyl sulfoxide reductase chain B [Moorella glycerini]